MAHLLALVLLIGFVDSLNPATVAPALYLAGGHSPHKSLLGFIAGVFAVNLVAGVLLALGPGQAILALSPRPGPDVRHMLELSGGILTFLVAIGLWLARGRLERHVAGKEDRIDRSSLLVGAGITAAELPTAVPYFAVIAAVVGSGRAVSTQVGLLAAFNLAFVAPLLAIFVLRQLVGARALERVERLRTSIDRHLGTAIPALVLLIAVILTATGTVGLIRHHHNLLRHLPR
jgi:hypothetical protein